MVGQIAQQQFGTQGRGAKLGMGEPQIIDLFGHVVGKFVPQCEAQAARSALIVDDVDAGDFRLLPAIAGEGRPDQRFARRHKNGTISLVEPLGLDAFPALRLAAFKPHQEHPHRIGRGTGSSGLVHFVAPLGRAEMGQPRPTHQQMRVIGMVYGRQEPDGIQFKLISAAGLRRIGEADAVRQAFANQFVHRGCVFEDMGDSCVIE